MDIGVGPARFLRHSRARASGFASYSADWRRGLFFHRVGLSLRGRDRFGPCLFNRLAYLVSPRGPHPRVVLGGAGGGGGNHVALGFRPDAIDGFYAPGELWLVRSPTAFIYTQAAWGIVALLWIGLEATHWRKHPREWGRLLAIAIPGTVHFVALCYGQSVPQILFPLLVAHGGPYFALMGWSLRRTQTERFASLTKVALVLSVTALVLGGIEGGLEEFGLDAIFVGQGRLPWLTAFACGLYLVPLLSHFIFDAFLWRRAYQEPAALKG